MKIDKALIATIVFVLTFYAGICLGQYLEKKFSIQSTSTPKVIADVVFFCDENKFIAAKFMEKSVDLTLSDKREMALPQTISGSGARYANEDESFVFWNKGDTAFVQEGENYTYQNCALKK
jgi:membrane-bound inhibitor of C-type lysozyme